MQKPLLAQVLALAMTVVACGGTGTKKDAAQGGGGSAAGGNGGGAGAGTGGTGTGGAGLGGAGGNAGAGGSGGRDGAAGDANRSDGASSVGNAVCPVGGTMMCTQAEVDSYNTCLADKCDSAFKMCFGDIRNGNYGGPCGPWVMCTSKCGCNDAACRNACPMPNMECILCLVGPGLTCQNTANCPRPACYGPETKLDGGGLPPIPDGGFMLPDVNFNFPESGIPIPDGGFSLPEAGFSGTCAQLLTCCNGIADGAQKTQCLTAYAAFNMPGGGGDQGCAAVLTGLRAINACQ
jgi:hypothetical protein